MVVLYSAVSSILTAITRLSVISVRGGGLLKLGFVTIASVHCFLYEIWWLLSHAHHCFNFNETTHSRADTDIKLL